MRAALPAGEYGPAPADTSFQAEKKELPEETATMIEERTSFSVGEEATLTKTISDEDIKTFARISGDELIKLLPNLIDAITPFKALIGLKDERINAGYNPETIPVKIRIENIPRIKMGSL